MNGSFLSRVLAFAPFSRDQASETPLCSHDASDSDQTAARTKPREGYWARACTHLRAKGIHPPPQPPREKVTFFSSHVFPAAQSAWVWVSADEEWVFAGDLALGITEELAFKRGEPLTTWWGDDPELPDPAAFCDPVDRCMWQAQFRNRQLWAEASRLAGDEPFLRHAIGPGIARIQDWQTEVVRFHSHISHNEAGLDAGGEDHSPALLAKVTDRYGELVALQVQLLDPTTFEPTHTRLSVPSKPLVHASVKLGSRNWQRERGRRRVYLTLRLKDALYACVALGRTRLLLSPAQLRDYQLGGRADHLTVLLPRDTPPDVLEAVSWLRKVARQTPYYVDTIHID